MSISSRTTIVDSHHKVLLAWARLRAHLSKAPRLITLDHHTDTSKPFRAYIKKNYGVEFDGESQREKWLSETSFLNEVSLREAVAKLSNDEHIQTAIKTDIISSAFVIAHNARDTDLQTYFDHKIMCRSVDRNQNSNDVSREKCDKVLETSFLEEVFESFNGTLREIGEVVLFAEPYILDIDLDYFNTFESVKPKDLNLFRMVARNASMITIATEPDYVRTCSLDPGLTSEILLKHLIEFIETNTPN